MPYEHCCFISYKHPPVERHYSLEFVRELKDQLEFFLNTGIHPYFDDNLRSRVGVHYPMELSQKLCKSVCMVAVLTPEYLESEWCKAEWKAMESLEAKRLQNTKGLILPIIFRGSTDDFNDLLCDRQAIEISGLLNPKRELTNRSNRRKIKNIADMIDAHCKSITDTYEDCDHFLIQVGDEVLRPIINELSPFKS